MDIKRDMKSMTYGTLPTREEFNVAFERECPNGYHITLGRSDARALAGFKLGGGVWTSDQLWEAIREITCYSWPDELALDLVSGIMETLGFEWI